MYYLPPKDQIQALNIADPSLISSWVSSYDPLSPSYDPCAASPCNPFPSSSPFAAVSFARENAHSKLGEVLALPRPSPLQQPASFSRIPPPHSAPYLRRTKPCRFYLDAAGCKSGRWCNFKHPVGARSEDSEHTAHASSELDELREAVIRSRTTTTAWDDVPDVRDVDPDWGKKGSPEDNVHPKWRTQPCRNFLLGLCRYGDKCQFIHAPGLFPVIPPSDSYPTSLPLPVLPQLDSPLTAPTGTPHTLPVPLSIWGPHPGIGVPVLSTSTSPSTSTNPSTSSPDASPRPKSEQASLHYRTKPCKYLQLDTPCPHGSECHFIHDSTQSVLAFSPQDEHERPSWADDDRALDLDVVPSFLGAESKANEYDDVAMRDMTNNNTSGGGDAPGMGAGRSASMRRRDRERVRAVKMKEKEQKGEGAGGVWKPMWRVVGGGVMLAKECYGNGRGVQGVERDAEDDAVFEYQPCDMSMDTHDHAYPPHNYEHDFDTNANVNTDYITFSINPADYPPSELLCAPSPASEVNGTFCVEMGKFEGWREDGVHSRTPSPFPSLLKEGEREKQKPRLTIAVPASSSGADSGAYYKHRRTRSYNVAGGRLAGYAAQTQTDAGDDVLDWGEDGSECGETVEVVCGGLSGPAGGADIRRVRSTPPTPRSGGTYLYVPIPPRLVAESP